MHKIAFKWTTVWIDCSSEQECLDVLEQYKQKYGNANVNCYVGNQCERDIWKADWWETDGETWVIQIRYIPNNQKIASGW